VIRAVLLLAALLSGAALPCGAQDVHGLAQRSSLHIELGPRARLLLQPPQRFAAETSPLALDQARASESGVGVEFKLRPASRSPRDLKQMLRVQLSQRSALQFRPRSGGLAITYREQF
jgi:hypothetical protein